MKRSPATDRQRRMVGGAQSWVKRCDCACGQEFKTLEQLNRHQVDSHGVKILAGKLGKEYSSGI